jgi:hypothetical protein
MKRNNSVRVSVLVLCACAVTAFLSPLNGAEQNAYLDMYKTGLLNPQPSPVAFTGEPENKALSGAAENECGKPGLLKWHKILGWSTAGMAVLTMASGSAFPHDGHCAIAGLTSGLSLASGVTGIMIGKNPGCKKRGKLQNHLHALMGSLATIGFVASCAMYNDKSSKDHALAGAASGAALIVSLAVLYF